MPTRSYARPPVARCTFQGDVVTLTVRGRPRAVARERLLPDLLALAVGPSADLQAVERFLRRYGWPGNEVRVSELRQLAVAVRALRTLSAALGASSPASRKASVAQPYARPVSSVAALLAWLETLPDSDVAFLRRLYKLERSRDVLTIDLSRFPLADWHSSKEPPDLTFARVGDYHIPAALEVAGPDAIAAWVAGRSRWSGHVGAARSPAVTVLSRRPQSARERLQDEFLWNGCLEVWLAWRLPPLVSWVREPGEETLADARPRWDTTPRHVVDALAAEVIADATGVRRLATCTTCGATFPIGGKTERGRPRSECPDCYDPNTSRRKAAKKCADAKKSARKRARQR